MHFRDIQRLLTAIYCPKEEAVMHCKGHSRDGSKAAEGNQLADCQARKAALQKTPSVQRPLIWTGPVEQEKTQYTEEELERYEKRRTKITDNGWLQSEDGRLIIPENAQWKILKGLHQSFHLGAESTYQMASCLFEGKNVMKTLKNISKGVRFVRKITQRLRTQPYLDYNEVESLPERPGKLILLICQKLFDILPYKFGQILLLDGLRLFPVIVSRLRKFKRF